MNCVLCDLSKGRVNPALFTVFGSSVCQQDANDLIEHVADGDSMRDIVDKAKAGDW